MKREVNMRACSNKDTNKKRGESNDISDMKCDGDIVTDPFGSWTGTPVDGVFEKPVQDVDDL